MNKDEVFSTPIKKQFEFDKDVAVVFDNMISRSVPYYQDVVELVSSIVIKNTEKDDFIYDLGCSTANTLLSISNKSDKKLNLIGIDNSPDMLNIAKSKISIYNANIKLHENNILDFNFDNKAKVVLSNYTLQFVRPINREDLVKKIFDNLLDDGMFIFSEKIIYNDKTLNKQLIEEYYEYKEKQGYSKFEIMQKREALENVLVPYSQEENFELLKRCGFKSVDTIFKWANFCTFIAKK
jgi:tRNA (cmo5U34)-methyltransferase